MVEAVELFNKVNGTKFTKSYCLMDFEANSRKNIENITCILCFDVLYLLRLKTR